jgi:hypothetical protein
MWLSRRFLAGTNVHYVLILDYGGDRNEFASRPNAEHAEARVRSPLPTIGWQEYHS